MQLGLRVGKLPVRVGTAIVVLLPSIVQLLTGVRQLAGGLVKVVFRIGKLPLGILQFLLGIRQLLFAVCQLRFAVLQLLQTVGVLPLAVLELLIGIRQLAVRLRLAVVIFLPSIVQLPAGILQLLFGVRKLLPAVGKFLFAALKLGAAIPKLPAGGGYPGFAVFIFCEAVIVVVPALIQLELTGIEFCARLIQQFFGTVQLLQCFGRRRAGCGQLLHGHSKLFGLVGQRLETGLIGGFALRQLLQAIL